MSSLDEQTWDELVAAIRADEPGLKLYLEWRPPTLAISLISVPPARRGQGVARRVAERLIEAADARGVQLAVTPTGEFGADVWRLRWFYRRLGFVRNAGDRRDYTCKEDLLRPPGGAGSPCGEASGRDA